MNKFKNNQRKNFKRGIAMIELIFALVIIGIVLLSAPMLIQQSSQSNAVALQQEAIAAVASHTSILLTKHWDEFDANLSAGAVAPILKTTSGDFRFDFNTTTSRKGIEDNITGRMISVQRGVNNNVVTLTASAIGSDGGDSDDIDDYDNTSLGLELYTVGQETNASVGDYVDLNLTMTTIVRYINDSPATFGTVSSTNNMQTQYSNPALAIPAGGTSNIKFVNVQLTTANPALNDTPELNKSILLQAFSCNIGAVVPKGDQK